MDGKKTRIVRFLADETTSLAVKEALLRSFLKKREQKDVQVLAASMLAVQFLEEAWLDLDRYAESEEDQTTRATNVGV